MNARDRALPVSSATLAPALDVSLYLAPFAGTDETARDLASGARDTASYVADVFDVAALHAGKTRKTLDKVSRRQAQVAADIADALRRQKPGDLADYVTDFCQRSILFMDVLRRRGNNFLRQEREGSQPVLAYDYDVVVDGSKLEQPVNYSLVAIRPPEGVEVRADARPFIIIDPRAGHGSGIGGFKSESEVGAALRAGHPVYFCIFAPHPARAQTLADVTRAEAQFVREVQRRHPGSPKPVIIGNCQGGWAAMLLAATNPDLAGPLVINGAPLSYWAGTRGKNPMRYIGGLFGGATPALLAADLGNGEFDGANLVSNFEALNPGNSWWKKYWDVFANVEEEGERYLEFERWWSGFYYLNREEMRWIVENLFVGNRLGRGGAQLDSRMHVDLRNIRAPVIVFASHGDNITPPSQALSWITDCYSSVQDIRARGQRILYTVHDSVGHLGIFVSSSVAKKEHREIVSTLQAIETLPPGLYEMKIVEETGEGVGKRFAVTIEARTLQDIEALDDGRDDEKPFAAVARLSRLTAEFYDLFTRPLVRAATNPATARWHVDSLSIRAERYALSDLNPALAAVAPAAQSVKASRRKPAPGNPYLAGERACAALGTEWLDAARDVRDGLVETWFYGMYASPLMRAIAAGEPQRISEVPGTDLRAVPEVRSALAQIGRGNFAVAVIRMLVLLAFSRGAVRRERFQRMNDLLTRMEPFASLDEATRTRIIHQQVLIVEFEAERAIATLPRLVADPRERRRALELCERVAGDPRDWVEETRSLFERMRLILEVKPQAPPKKAARARSRPREALHVH